MPSSDVSRVFFDSLADARIVVCCGAGGVGKTTLSAALGLWGAMEGRKTVVLTIDPARRLADALGLSALDHEPRRVAESVFDGIGPPPPGELWAMMLDTKHTFDRLVSRFAPTPEMRSRILNNRYYRHLSASLAGSHEYMAMEKLHEIHGEDRFDLIVLDTPPTRSALDFLDAPRRLSNLFADNLFWKLVRPYVRTGLFGLKMFAFFASPIYKAVGRVLGTAVIEDLLDFFQLGDDLFFDGFRKRAEAIHAVLSGPSARFVAVASPTETPMREARFFHEKLVDSEMPFGGFIINRVNPIYPEPAGPLPADPAPGVSKGLLERLAANLRDLQTLGRADAAAIEALKASVGPEVPIIEIPRFEEDVHDIGGLMRVYGHYWGV